MTEPGGSTGGVHMTGLASFLAIKLDKCIDNEISDTNTSRCRAFNRQGLGEFKANTFVSVPP